MRKIWPLLLVLTMLLTVCLLAAVVSIAEPTSHCASFFHSPMTASPVPLLSETAAHGTL